jgi:hypothetical protein
MVSTRMRSPSLGRLVLALRLCPPLPSPQKRRRRRMKNPKKESRMLKALSLLEPNRKEQQQPLPLWFVSHLAERALDFGES